MEKIIFTNDQTPALNDTNLNQLQTNVENALNLKADTSSLSTVATTNNYNDLDNKPTNNSYTLNGLSEKSYNSLTDKPSIPNKTSDLTNDSGFINKEVNNLTNYTKTSDLIETGTWTPVLSKGSSQDAVLVPCTYTNQTGKYRKIGNLVNIDFYIIGKITGDVGTHTGGIIVGLPYELKMPISIPGGVPMIKCVDPQQNKLFYDELSYIALNRESNNQRSYIYGATLIGTFADLNVGKMFIFSGSGWYETNE